MNTKLLSYHSTIQRAALGISKTLDGLWEANGEEERLKLVRQGKAQLRVLIDMGLEIGKLLEETDTEASIPSKLGDPI